MMIKHFLATVTVVFLLSGCALTQNDEGAFSTVPVENRELVIYTCTGVETQFANYRPTVNSIMILPRSVIVVDNGSNWVATWEGGKLESPQLYKDLMGKVDGNINVVTGTRFYRTHATLTGAPSFDYSTVAPSSGNGTGMTFFHCTDGSVMKPTQMLTVVK